MLADDMRLGQPLQQEDIDMVWLNTSGVQGRSPMSHGAAMLEMMGVPYLVHDPLMSGILDSKYIFEKNVSYLGMSTAAFTVWNPATTGSPDSRQNRRFRRAYGDFNGPFIVKPVSGRDSLHVNVVDEAADMADAIDAVYSATENDVLIETYLSGRKYCIAVGGPVVSLLTCLDRYKEPFAFSAAVRALGKDERIFTSMDQRPITGDRIFVLNAEVDGPEIDELRAITRSVHEDMQLESVTRLGIRADANGALHILKANPKPNLAALHMSAISRDFMQAKQASNKMMRQASLRPPSIYRAPIPQGFGARQR
jgi:D-alanine-D-alanine ligase